MMNECLTWFTYKWIRRTQYITSIGLFYKKWESWGGEFSGE